MELLIAMIVATYVVKNGAVDLAYAVRGTPSPRQVAAAKRADAVRALAEARAVRQGRPRPHQPGAFSSYLAQLWEDGWTDARSRHTVRRDRRQARPSRSSRPRGAFRTYAAGVAQDGWRRWDAAWERADERRRARPSRDDPVPNKVTVPGRIVPNQDDRTDPQDGPQDDGQLTDDETLVVAGTGIGKSRLMNHHHAHGWKSDTPSTPAASTASTATMTRDGHPTNPNTIAPTLKGTTAMTTNTIPAGEATGLATGISFCSGTADAFESAVTSIEATAAQLESREITAGAGGHLASAQEHAAAAAASMRAAEAQLQARAE